MAQPKPKAGKNRAQAAAEVRPVSLRLPPRMVERIDRIIQTRGEQRFVTVTRHSWMVEALAEKMERESREFNVAF